MVPAADVTQLLADLHRGDPAAADRMLPLVYDELRRLAEHHLRRERPDHTLQATALVHEVYLRLVNQTQASPRDRAHFFAVAATAIRRVLVDHARSHGADKRGGGRERVSIQDTPSTDRDPLELLSLDDALSRLAAFDPRKSRVVELKFFAGLEIAEIAAALDVSHATVERDWSVARAWLYRELGHGSDDEP